jgi:hypothetical protein
MVENPQLTDFIEVYKQAVSATSCDNIINKSSNYDWHLHRWEAYDKVVSREHDDRELSVANLDGLSTINLTATVKQCVSDYATKNLISINGYSRFRLNKYSVGTFMDTHVDHINSVFDGTRKGIPVLSIVGLLNDNFSGGEFVFFKDHKIELGQGDILVFPSVFLYPHRVMPVTEGTRYSFVQWAY